MNDPDKNPYQIADAEGNPRFSASDLRISGGGCYLRRDAHTNPSVKPPFFFNAIGKWYLKEVSMKDEQGHAISGMRGLYCTNCHNHLSHELYLHDDLRDATFQDGRTLRNRSISEVVTAIAGGDLKRFREFFADPIVGAEGGPLNSYYADHTSTVLLRSAKDKDGNNKAGSGSGCSIIPIIKRCNCRVVSADLAFRIPVDFDTPKLCLQPIEDE